LALQAAMKSVPWRPTAMALPSSGQPRTSGGGRATPATGSGRRLNNMRRHAAASATISAIAAAHSIVLGISTGSGFCDFVNRLYRNNQQRRTTSFIHLISEKI
jgi:hypothetical protein